MHKVKNVLGVIFIGLFFLISFLKFQTLNSHSANKNDEKVFKAKIISIEKEEESQFDNREYATQWLNVKITSGELKDREVIVQTGLQPKYKKNSYRESDKIIIGHLDTGIGEENFYLIGYSRTTPLLVLILIFITASLLIARKKGFKSLLGLTVSMTLLIVFILPAIAQGFNPLLTSILGAGSLIPILFYISHGFNKKTTAAVLGTIITFCITAVMAFIFVNWGKLSGISFEEVETLLYINDGNFDMQGILLSGILLGVLGVIDDIAITQASIVEELYITDKKISYKDLISKAMNVGRDHIGSVINTLLLVYVGGALTTLLLFTEFPRPFEVLINNEIVAIPLVVSLIGSLGLIIAVPITTIIASWIVINNKKWKKN